MEIERQRYAAEVAGVDAKGRAIIGPERKVGPVEKFEFGVGTDELSQAVGGSYISNFNPDFLQKEFGQKKGNCARFYFDRKVIVDIADPEEEDSKRKRKLCHKHGFGYLCIPPNFARNVAKIKRLYDLCIQDFYIYDKAHPRPTPCQEAIIVDSKGITRRAFMTAIDTRVGGGIQGNQEQQEKELKMASKMSKNEVKDIKLQNKLHRKLRDSVQSGVPFRNPFIAKNRRKFNVVYA